MVPGRRVQRGLGRDELLTATLRLIDRGGIQALSMRDIADEADMSLGSTTYHFNDRATLIAAALELHVAITEQVVDDAVGTSRSRREDCTAGGGVRSALAAVFADRGQVLIRHELRLDAARDDMHLDLHRRCSDAVRRLITAAVRADGEPATSDAVLAGMEAAAIDAAIEYRDPADFTAAMSRHLAATVAVRVAS